VHGVSSPRPGRQARRAHRATTWGIVPEAVMPTATSRLRSTAASSAPRIVRPRRPARSRGAGSARRTAPSSPGAAGCSTPGRCCWTVPRRAGTPRAVELGP